MIYTASLFPAFCFATALLLNFVGLLYGSLATVPFISVLSVLLMWALVALPLTVIGTILGRNWSGTPNVRAPPSSLARAFHPQLSLKPRAHFQKICVFGSGLIFYEF